MSMKKSDIYFQFYNENSIEITDIIKHKIQVVTNLILDNVEELRRWHLNLTELKIKVHSENNILVYTQKDFLLARLSKSKKNIIVELYKEKTNSPIISKLYTSKTI